MQRDSNREVKVRRKNKIKLAACSSGGGWSVRSFFSRPPSSPSFVTLLCHPPLSPTFVAHRSHPLSLPTVISHRHCPPSLPTIVAHRCCPLLLPTVVAHYHCPPLSPIPSRPCFLFYFILYHFIDLWAEPMMVVTYIVSVYY